MNKNQISTTAFYLFHFVPRALRPLNLICLNITVSAFGSWQASRLVVAMLGFCLAKQSRPQKVNMEEPNLTQRQIRELQEPKSNINNISVFHFVPRALQPLNFICLNNMVLACGSCQEACLGLVDSMLSQKLPARLDLYPDFGAY